MGGVNRPFTEWKKATVYRRSVACPNPREACDYMATEQYEEGADAAFGVCTKCGHSWGTKVLPDGPLRVPEPTENGDAEIGRRLRVWLKWFDATHPHDSNESDWKAGHAEAMGDVRCFVVEGYFAEFLRDEAEGPGLSEAEREAARVALAELRGKEPEVTR